MLSSFTPLFVFLILKSVVDYVVTEENTCSSVWSSVVFLGLDFFLVNYVILFGFIVIYENDNKVNNITGGNNNEN